MSTSTMEGSAHGNQESIVSLPEEVWERELTSRDGCRMSAVPEGTVIDWFEHKVRQHPHHPALICGGKVVSYGELNGRADELAQRLIELGVRGGAPVAISAERSPEMIQGLLGILKAGGAYVPLDPGYPKERLSFVLRDCGARVLVTQPHLAQRLPAHDCALVEIGRNSNPLSAPPAAHARVHRVQPESFAYIIYTSGSTGQPKGVAITHRNLAYSTAARFESYKEPISNYLLLSSFAFDSSIAGIFWTLTQGATLTIPPEGAHQDPKELLAIIREYRVSHLLALPSFYQAILEQAVDEDLISLQAVIVAGEACASELVNRHFAELRQVELFNEYGPTEGTVWATVHRCDRNGESGTVPIGRPAPHMWVCILNEEGTRVKAGQIGEIHIGGPALAKGYLHRDDLTRERFIRNPLKAAGASDLPGRLYRTGDLGRYRSDGCIEFHGRVDDQVKIRGHRIEIGEIEAVLRSHPRVREAAVAAREDALGEKRLVAYVVPTDKANFSMPQVRRHLQECLPEVMVPARFVIMETIPLMPNGKVDRQALSGPEESGHESRAMVPPKSADEENLAQIWSEVLKVNEPGTEENFFDLGGHSLLAIQVIARVRETFQLNIPIAAFFQSPTIRGLAAAVARCREEKRAAVPAIRRAVRVAASQEILATIHQGMAK